MEKPRPSPATWRGQRTGATESLIALPHFSPSGRRFVAVGQDILSDSYIDLWSVKGEPGIREFSYATERPFQEMWGFVAWEGDDRLRLRAVVTEKKGGHTKTYDTEAVYSAQGWHLKRPWATRSVDL